MNNGDRVRCRKKNPGGELQPVAKTFRLWRAACGSSTLLALCTISPAWALDASALPSGGSISAGSGNISSSGNAMLIRQNTGAMAINWQSYNIGSAASVTYNQPSSSAVVLNRVVGSGASEIYGRLNANGQVFILNSNGILFGPGAQINVGGLVASSLDLSDEAFVAGAYRFGGAGGRVINQGEITGQYIALIGAQVSNQGTITARLGKVILAAGRKMTLDFAGDGLASITLEEGAVNALAENRQLIKADGGTVILTAKAADAVIKAVVNNEGVIEAKTVENQSGTIVLLSDRGNGVTQVGGTLNASAETGNGGVIETSGKEVSISENAVVTTQAANGQTGTWLIDPTNFTIDASYASSLSSILGVTNITLETQSDGSEAGDINVNAALAWNANTTLKLSAHGNININANISATLGTLKLYYGQATIDGSGSSYNIGNGAKMNLSAGNHFYSKQGILGAEKSWKVITALGAAGSTSGTDLQGMNGNLTGNYVLGADIDASATSSWNSGAGFDPLGNSAMNSFVGSFDGLGHTISGLSITRGSTTYVGLFGYATGASVANLGLVNANIAGGNVVGSLVGYLDAGSINRSYASGAVQGANDVGGLVGHLASGSITNSYASDSVTSTGDGAGGLVGRNEGSIDNSYANGSVSGTNNAGALVGHLDAGSISHSYATGSVTGSSNLGGFVGQQTGGTISNSFWDRDTTLQANACGAGTCTGATGMTTTQMKDDDTFNDAGWSVSNAGGSTAVWRIYDGYGYPLLRSFLTSLTITANSGSRTYDGTTNAFGVTYSSTPDGSLLSGTLTMVTPSKNIGTYTVNASGLYSANPLGYDIAYASGTATISAITLTLGGTTSASSKVYDGTTTASLSGGTISGVIGSETVVLSQSGDFSDKHVGAGKTVTYANNLSGADAGNYVLNLSGGTTTANITAASLTVSGTSASNKVYDGTTTASLSGGTISGVIGGETVVFSQSGSFDDKNVGTGKTVTYANSLSGTDAGNYVLNSAGGTTTANITPAALTVTVNNDSKWFDGQSYSGGKGASYSGFVAGEDASVLSGSLIYGGTSQGAINAGSYSITASGLLAANYALRYVDGTLIIRREETYKPTISTVDNLGLAQGSQGGSSIGAFSPLLSASLLAPASVAQVIEGGMRLPQELLSGEGAPASGGPMQEGSETSEPEQNGAPP